MLFLALPSRQLVFAATPQEAVVALLRHSGVPPIEAFRLHLIPLPEQRSGIFFLTPEIVKELNNVE